MRCGFWRCCNLKRSGYPLLLMFISSAMPLPLLAEDVRSGTPLLLNQSAWPEELKNVEGDATHAGVLILDSPQEPVTPPPVSHTLEISEPTMLYLPQGVEVIHAETKTYRTPELAEEVRKHYTINITVYGLWVALGIALVL